MLVLILLVEAVNKDTLPEWSKGVDSSSTSASCAGSNPTGVICATAIPEILYRWIYAKRHG